jgi:hypothetical protein
MFINKIIIKCKYFKTADTVKNQLEDLIDTLKDTDKNNCSIISIILPINKVALQGAKNDIANFCTLYGKNINKIKKLATQQDENYSSEDDDENYETQTDDDDEYNQSTNNLKL